MVRAKFKVHYKKEHDWGVEVEMSPVISGSEENKAFWNATPSGSIKMFISNKPAAEALELNGEYYVDFTKAG